MSLLRAIGFRIEDLTISDFVGINASAEPQPDLSFRAISSKQDFWIECFKIQDVTVGERLLCKILLRDSLVGSHPIYLALCNVTEQGAQDIECYKAVSATEVHTCHS